MLATIIDGFYDVLAFLQAVAVKSPRFTAAPLSLCADKRTRVCFRCWKDINLITPPKPDQHYHMGIKGVLTNVVTMLHT